MSTVYTTTAIIIHILSIHYHSYTIYYYHLYYLLLSLIYYLLLSLILSSNHTLIHCVFLSLHITLIHCLLQYVYKYLSTSALHIHHTLFILFSYIYTPHPCASIIYTLSTTLTYLHCTHPCNAFHACQKSINFARSIYTQIFATVRMPYSKRARSEQTEALIPQPNSHKRSNETLHAILDFFSAPFRKHTTKH